MEKKPPLLPGEKELLAKQAEEKRKADAQEAKKRKAAQEAEPRQSSAHAAKIEKVALKAATDQPKSKPPEVECQRPPPFDMLDLPGAMNNMRFFHAAQLARRWFNSRKHTIPNDRHYVYPDDMVETKIISLDFVLKHPAACAKYANLINKEIYTDDASNAIRKRIRALMTKKFVDENIVYSRYLDTLAYCGGDIQKLNAEFRFQDENVSNFDTLDWSFGLTDLTATLANFNFIAAIANARIQTQQYYSHPKGAPMVHCCESTVEVTHIYVYVRDSYSFADKPGKKASQYLGHWNKAGAVLVADAVASDLANKFAGRDIQWGDIPYSEQGFDRPVDLLRGMFGQQMRKHDVYYPVRNTDYRKWREKFNRGGDFVIYSKPMKIKLPTPITFILDEICKSAKLA